MKCSGWTPIGRRKFSFGEPAWAQCPNKPTVYLTVSNRNHQRLPACDECHKRVIQDKKMIIREVEPFLSQKEIAAQISKIIEAVEWLVSAGLEHRDIQRLIADGLAYNDDYMKLERMTLYMKAQA